jgi:hypothetical protein
MKIPHSDSLRTPKNICDPDPRQKHFKIHDRQVSLEGYYTDISEIELHEYVPNDVRIHFETAKNLALYSWFVYRFDTVAELQGYASVEFALKEKSKQCNKYKKNRRLSGLFTLAIKERWINDKDFPSYMNIEKSRSEYMSQMYELSEIEPSHKEKEDLQKYCKIICKTFPSLRNTLAHGSPSLHRNAERTLEVCGELINQLFKP